MEILSFGELVKLKQMEIAERALSAQSFFMDSKRAWGFFRKNQAKIKELEQMLESMAFALEVNKIDCFALRKYKNRNGWFRKKDL